MNSLKLLVVGCIGLALSGCAATPKIALEYRPKTIMELKGTVAVGNFGYFPKEGVSPMQIPNTALGGGIMLTEPIGDFFANAVRQEFRQAGISLKESGCKLEGEVNEILIDDLGFTVDYNSDVRYILYDKNGKVLMDNRYQVKLDKMTKFVVVEVLFQNINKMLSDNIKQLMQDETFAMSLSKNCM